MKKSFFLAIAALCATMTFAITPQELADSLNVFASQRAYLGKVKVSDIQIDEKNITINTCNRLSCISLTPEEIAGLKESVRQWVGGAPTAEVQIISDGKELDEWVTALYRKRDKKLQYKPASAKYPLVHNASQPYSAKQGLDGKHIALWGSHGIYYVQAYRMWKWQRARLWTTIEDLYTSSYTMPFLVPMLENAGAVVLQPRERDTQLHEVIIDDSQLSEGITPSNDAGWGRPLKPLLEGDNPFTMGTYSTVNSRAQYTPNLPEEGEYAVYVSYKSLPNSNPQASKPTSLLTTKKRDANKIASLPNISNLSLTYYKNPKYENEANIHTSLAFLQLLLDKDEFEPRYIRTYSYVQVHIYLLQIQEL